MRVSIASLSLVLLHSGLVASDYLVPVYPSPRDLTSSKSTLPEAWKNLTSTFNGYMAGKRTKLTAGLKGAENVTFSVGMFSLNDPNVTQLQYHYTSPEIKKSKEGTHSVNENSIYRVASVSKLITTFAGLLELSEDDWNRPLSKINPEFEYRLKNAAADDPVLAIQWDKITPWSLASQLSGIPTTGVALADKYNPAKAAAYGFPPVNVTALGVCALRAIAGSQWCDAPDSIAGIVDQQPNFEMWSTPSYSDLNFMLLGVAISNITGKSISSVYRNAIFGPLNMTSSNDTHPTEKALVARSVVAGEPAANFAVETDFTGPSGGILSTISDLQKFGYALLNNTLLSAEATRKWMKPISHTPSWSYSIGAPWEIHRYVSPKTGRAIDIYTKLGDSGYYGGTVAIIPEFDAGFTMLNAGTTPLRGQIALAILDYVNDAVIPALEAQALSEAMKNFVGTYKSEGEVNGTITIGYKKSNATTIKSDLILTKWLYNGTDVMNGPFFMSDGLRLEQAIPDAGKGTVAFDLSDYIQTLTYQEAIQFSNVTGTIGSWTGFYNSNEDFAYTDASRWGGVPMRKLVFDVDDNGKATCVSPVAQRITLKRVEE